MNIDPLIGSMLRSINSHVLTLTESPAGTALPGPKPDISHLLYLHIPYCVVLCPFCSFHRVEFKRDSATTYFDCLRREIELVTDMGYRFDELYVGGGTPTVMPAELLKTLDMLRGLHSLESISVETNPDDLELDTLSALRDAGVNRLSVGVQSFDDNLLKEMQRFDKYGSGKEIIDRLVRVAGVFDTLNVDIIFNFPHQTEQSLSRDLDCLIDEVGVDQVSFYPLMTVGSTRKRMLRTVGEVDYSKERRLYEQIVERMLAAGYKRASAWCFSRQPGMFDEYIAEREEYVGLGSGAFSYLDGSLFASTFSINHYRQRIEAGKTGTTCKRQMSLRDRMRYHLMMKLFSGSVDLAAAEKIFNGQFELKLWPELAALRAIGATRRDGMRLALTESGYYLWVIIMREFFTSVNTLRDQMRHKIPEEGASLGPGVGRETRLANETPQNIDITNSPRGLAAGRQKERGSENVGT